MNILHRWICSSDRWKRSVETDLLPWALDGLDLGPNVLELGPAYGATTEALRERVDRLTCLEINARLAEGLHLRNLGQNVTVLTGDATAMSFPNAAFDSAVCFTMLHHVPSVPLQNRLLAEVARVLKPGGIFAGTDSIDRPFFRALHVFDTLVPVDPKTLPARLTDAGFEEVRVEANSSRFRFRARKPG